MDFGTQIKNLRMTNDLTQQTFADKLSISRQAISNWENNRNLPDIDMLIQISSIFNISLDELILGGKDMNNMTEKLINDGNETRRAKINLVSTAIGGILMILGFICFVIKAMSVEYIDANGVLHENFFLIPIGYILLFCGAIVIIGNGMRLFIKRRNQI